MLTNSATLSRLKPARPVRDQPASERMDAAVELLAIDIGGTHARFALAELDGTGAISLGAVSTFRVADHANLDGAWAAFAAITDRPLPNAVAIAAAAVAEGELIELTNNSWTISLPRLRERLAGGPITVVNDFAAISHAVVQLPQGEFQHLCGPEVPLPDEGVVTICGPGTGLGVALLIRHPAGYMVVPTAGGHIHFALTDPVEEALLCRLRRVHGRVSAERICAGPGLAVIRRLLAEQGSERAPELEDRELWTEAFGGGDLLAVAALERFRLVLAAIAGDLALSHGAKGVVIAGGLGLRMGNWLRHPAFGERFAAKGRFRSMMERLPVKLLTHPQPGLLGAVAAFAREHASPTLACVDERSWGSEEYIPSRTDPVGAPQFDRERP